MTRRRSYVPVKSGVATDASCFPLVPFANRVSGNRFVWQGREYQLQPNVEWDAHYLHGDGWLGQWQCVRAAKIACVWCMNIAAVFITIG